MKKVGSCLTEVTNEDIQNGTFIIPSYITAIGCNAFKWCTNLTNLIISDSVTNINRLAFYCCSLKSIHMHINISICSYESLSLFYKEQRANIVINSIKTYYTGKIKYKEEDINKFEEYIKEHKKEASPYILNDIDTLYFVFDNMVYSFDDIDSLIEMTTDTEIRAILLKYADKLRGQKSIEDIFDENYDLDKYLNENLDEKKPPQKRKK